MKGRRTLVLGGAGFIGSHLVDALLEGGAQRVAVMDNFFLGRMENLANARASYGDALEVFREDASEFNALKAVVDEVRPDIVFNLATKALPYSFFNPVGACRVNMDIALGLAELLREGRYSRLLHVSSSEVYGTALRVPMNEEHPLNTETTYAAGKAAADLALAAYVRMFELDVATVRPFNNYGPRQNSGSFAAVIPLTIDRIERGELPVLQGDGNQTRDFVHVADTVDLILRVAATDEASGHVLNVGSGVETRIGDVLRMVCQHMDYTGPIRELPARPADVGRHCADVSRLTSLIGDLSLIPFEKGLVRTVRWYQEHRSWTPYP